MRSRRGGDGQGKDIDPVVEVFPETAFADHVGQIAVGGHDYSAIGREVGIAADLFEDAFLEDAQQLALERERHVADLVEEDGSPVGQAEFSLPIMVGTGKGAPDMSKQFALQEVVGNCRAVDRDESGWKPVAGIVDGPGQYLFAGTALSVNGYRGLTGGSDFGGTFQQLPHDRVQGDDTLERETFLQESLDLFIFTDDMQIIEGSPDGDLQLFRVGGLFQKIVSPPTHGLYGALDATMGGDDDSRNTRIPFPHLPEEFKAVHARHDQV